VSHCVLFLHGRKQNLWLTQKKLALTTFNIHYKWALSRCITAAVSEWRFNRYKGKLQRMLGLQEQHSQAQRIINEDIQPPPQNPSFLPCGY